VVDLVNELNGKVAIVTGSARNIGRATAIELARGGASVIINSRSSMDLCEQVKEEIEAAGGKAAIAMGNIGDEKIATAIVSQALDSFGGVDILVNNAAVRSNIPLLGLNQTEWDRISEPCVRGSFNLSRLCIPSMVERGGGAIVSLAGMSSYRGNPGRAHVMAAKDALMGLTRGLAIEFGRKNIRANTAVVGRFDTLRSANAPTHGFSEEPDIPMGRMGTPQDMANLIRFLVGPGATYLSGQTIHLNGAALCPH
jgi:3-oxoacyl-[acyl-carrier protein] reductase